MSVDWIFIPQVSNRRCGYSHGAAIKVGSTVQEQELQTDSLEIVSVTLLL